jgi:hypothetical protein
MSKLFSWLKQIFPWLGRVLEDIDGSPSSKRVIAFMSMIFMMVLGVVNTIYSMHVEQYIFESFRDIVIASVGFVGAEKFAPKKTVDSSE